MREDLMWACFFGIGIWIWYLNFFFGKKKGGGGVGEKGFGEEERRKI